MKKRLFALAAVIAFQVSAAFAAPVNDLGAGETAVGFSSVDYYLEHQLTDNLTLGYQNADRDFYGDMDDIYGQYRLTENLRVLVGNRDLPYGSSNFYGGLAASAQLAGNISGYASYVTGADFGETQIGTNVAVAQNVDFNLNYHSFNPDRGRSEDGFGFGATLKF